MKLDKYLVGVDIGGTQVRVALARTDDLNVDNIEKMKQNTSKEDPEGISRQVISMIEALVEKKGIQIDQVCSINIATAGPIDMEKGEVFNNANLGFKIIPLSEPISKHFPSIPINLINDCNGAVLGVHLFEAYDEERDNIAYITISTGIGGGIVANGRLLLGKEGNAAEVGHGVVDPHSENKCNCGGIGCWESFSSGTAVMNKAREIVITDEGKKSLLHDMVHGNVNLITAKEVYQAAKKGDELSKKLVDKANFYNATGIGLINNFFDVKVVFLGGSMMKDKDQILPVLKDYFKKEPITFTINNPPEIRKSSLGDEVGLLGALALGKYKLEKNPVLL
ncbi:MAG: ROK family protein [Candidatus Hodarchaeota archaeon]